MLRKKVGSGNRHLSAEDRYGLSSQQHPLPLHFDKHRASARGNLLGVHQRLSQFFPQEGASAQCAEPVIGSSFTPTADAKKREAKSNSQRDDGAVTMVPLASTSETGDERRNDDQRRQTEHEEIPRGGVEIVECLPKRAFQQQHAQRQVEAGHESSQHKTKGEVGGKGGQPDAGNEHPAQGESDGRAGKDAELQGTGLAYPGDQEDGPGNSVERLRPGKGET
ncbi:hypothetical protein SDC9_61085 [bioreactor metagenome]|uniref:Uncharacterized protein n=1 Tax=bioreactor metagenome TaxID=1076179 RepID=A0A644XG36_9ZZZZ